MSLFRDSMRPPPIASDAALRRYLEIIQAEIEPDPLFRRRLRGLVLNEFVAAREGVALPSRRGSRAMGRLGRACLYASVAVAMSVGVTMAASQTALPGDPLYGVKLRIEELRVEALPAGVQDDLAIYMLSERVSELGRLAEAGRLDEVAALAGVIHDQAAAVEALGIALDQQNGLLASRIDVLAAIADHLPPEAQAAVAQALRGAPGLTKDGPGTPATGRGQTNQATGDDANDSQGDAAAVPPGQVTSGSNSNGHGPAANGIGSGNGGGSAPTSGEPEPSPAPVATTPEPSPSAKTKAGGSPPAHAKGGGHADGQPGD